MKIKGAVGKTGKGKRRGDPIEYTPEEKVPLAVQDGVKALNDSDHIFYAEDIVVDKHSHMARKASVTHKYANNAYMAEGKVTYRKLNSKKDKLYPAMTRKFKIQFEDCLDSIGVPDLKVVKFELLK